MAFLFISHSCCSLLRSVHFIHSFKIAVVIDRMKRKNNIVMFLSDGLNTPIVKKKMTYYGIASSVIFFFIVLIFQWNKRPKKNNNIGTATIFARLLNDLYVVIVLLFVCAVLVLSNTIWSQLQMHLFNSLFWFGVCQPPKSANALGSGWFHLIYSKVLS